MNQKTKLIVNEIKHWRKNKLLPEQYCDFLLALYLQGEEDAHHERSTQKSIISSKLVLKKRIESSRVLSPWLKKVIVCFFTATVLLALYFSLFFEQMQIPFGIFLFPMCGIGLLLGLWFKNFFFQCLSLLVIVLYAAWLTIPYFSERLNPAMLEGSWIGLALLVLSLAWILRKVNPKFCLTLYINGAVMLFVPSFQSLLIPEFELGFIPVLLILKCICIGLLIYFWSPFRAALS